MAVPSGTTTYRAALALIDGAVVADVGLTVDAIGTLVAVQRGAVGGEPIAGLVVPGLANVHSHAFQRAMAGLAERAGPDGDNFWCWREVMYRFLGTLSPDDVQTIAAQLYVECLRHGYTSVAEFHYLHNAPDGAPYADPAELSRRIAAAAEEAGIGLTLLPVLYRHGDFGAAPATPGQRRFLLTPDAFADLVATMARTATVGVAPHSLRAVAPDDLRHALAVAGRLGPATPVHIHVAEQVREVEACVAWSGARPVQWLLDHAPVGPHWCLIHATHVDPAERARMAASGAVAGLCQTTEANLGDGSFPLLPYLADGGRFGIGSDSNVSTSPVEELRWLDYIRRIEQRARAVSHSVPGHSIGVTLLERAAQGGAQALGRPAGRLAAGLRADWVVLDTGHPALAGRSGTALVDSWLFAGNESPVRDVMVGGRWVVRDGRHPHGEAIARRFVACMHRLAAAL